MIITLESHKHDNFLNFWPPIFSIKGLLKATVLKWDRFSIVDQSKNIGQIPTEYSFLADPRDDKPATHIDIGLHSVSIQSSQ